MWSYKLNELDTDNVIDLEILISKRQLPTMSRKQEDTRSLTFQVPCTNRTVSLQSSLTSALPFPLCLFLCFGKENGFWSQGKIKGFENLGKILNLSQFTLGIISAMGWLLQGLNTAKWVPGTWSVAHNKRETAFNIIFLKLKFSSTPPLPLNLPVVSPAFMEHVVCTWSWGWRDE